MSEQETELQVMQTQTTETTSFGTPAQFEHIQRVAKAFAASSIIPKTYQGSIPNTIIALEMANRMGASPIMIMQNLYIVHGMPSWSSTFIIASINSCGRFTTLKFEMSGSGDSLACKTWAIDKKDSERIEGPTVTMAMAKAEGWVAKNGSKWQTMPELMIRYRAATFFGRLYCPDILMGFQSYEEIIDVKGEVFPNAEINNGAAITYEDLVSLYDAKCEAGIVPDAIKANAVRILENKEVNSYGKLQRELNNLK